MPEFACDEVEEDGGDEHGRRDCHAVRGGEVRGGSEQDDEDDARQHEKPVNERDINLAASVFGGVTNGDAGEVAELNCG